jgi:hypothetical protein
MRFTGKDKNMKMTLNGTRLVIEIDLDSDTGLQSLDNTGPNKMVGSTWGWVNVPQSYRGIRISLNCIRPPYR